MKKRNIAVLLLTFLFVFLPSCVPVPENVQQDADALKQARDEMKKIKKEMNYVNVSDIYKGTPDTFNYKNGILNIDANVCVPQTERLYKLELEVNDLYSEKDALMKAFLNEEDYANLEKLTVDDRPLDYEYPDDGTKTPYEAFGWLFVEYGKNRRIDLDRCGWFSLFDTTKVAGRHFFAGPRGIPTSRTFFYNEIDDSFSESTKLEGIECKGLDIWKKFGEEVNMLTEKVPNFNCKPYSMRFYDQRYNEEEADENENYTPSKGISCLAAYEYKNAYFDPTDFNEQDNKNYSISRVPFSFCHTYHSPDDDCFAVLRRSYKVTKEAESYDKILDLDSALKVLQLSLAKARIAEIEAIELMYGLYYEGKEGTLWYDEYEIPPQFYAVPFWKFTEVTVGNTMIVHYVNAVTGEFYSYSSCNYPG